MKSTISVLLTTLFFAMACLAQAPAAKKSYTLKGKVVSVDEKAKTVTVDGEEVKGWMGAMTMAYGVDDPAMLKKLKAGDKITATVYDNDEKLHKVQVVPPTKP